ncbi:hypothetical protein QJS10_CPA03g02010 [Acorus calamus]|uniref:EGF-like domain-containing protein n=1 Tax=Acorus calamus TaxID=4465 RepID=A0AAV9F615_ACOCL|nr:hypothetical protein QJS10_CPA03g02010 [Acorus calamus]
MKKSLFFFFSSNTQMSFRIPNPLNPSLLLLLLSITASSSLPCEDTRCRTRSCDANGACICDLPDPSTILDGDRHFFGGRFCDEERVMCDGTNGFACEHGGECVEIVQGENYTCVCPPGFSGARCEHVGVPCGPIFCFHEGECLVQGQACKCPTDWMGSIDCSVPTDALYNSSAHMTPHAQSTDHIKFFVVALAILCAFGAVGFGLLARKCFRKSRSTAMKFQQLSKIDSEDDTLVAEVVTNDERQQ